MAQSFAAAQGAIFRAQAIAYAAGENLLPKEKGPFAIPCACDFGATGIPAQGYVIDPSRFYSTGQIVAIQSIYFDNSQCNGTTVVNIPAFNQVISLPPFSCGYFPILSPRMSGGVMLVTSNATNSGVANVVLLNTYFGAQTWSVLTQSQGGSIPVTDATLDGTVTSDGVAASSSKINVRTKVAQLTAVDKSGTIAIANTAQVLAAANVNRQGLEIQNMDTGTLEGLWYNPTGVAVVGGVGSFELAAASSANFPGGFAKIITSNAVSIIATTAGHKFSAIEY